MKYFMLIARLIVLLLCCWSIFDAKENLIKAFALFISLLQVIMINQMVVEESTTHKNK